jgi:hypothetical protein
MIEKASLGILISQLDFKKDDPLTKLFPENSFELFN